MVQGGTPYDRFHSRKDRSYAMDDMKTTSVSRGRFLTNSAIAAGAAVGAGSLLRSAPAAEAAVSRDVTTLTVMYGVGELNKQEIHLFEQQNPSIKIKQLEYDPVRLRAMMSSGQPPDFIRTQGAPEIVNIAARGLALNLDPYFANSKVLKVSDLQAINDVYRWDGKAQGQGPRYGKAKDWSQDNMFWYNKKLFDQAGVKYPSATEPMSYDDLLALGKKLTVRKNGKVLVYGLDAEYGFVMQGRIIQMLAQSGKSLWNSDYTQCDFTSPEVVKILKWYVDWAQAHVGPSPLDPEKDWTGPLFLANRVAIAMYGYWFQGMITSDTHGMLKHAGFAPSPQWGSKRISACMTGTGAWIPATTPNKQAAWKFFEYFMAQKPALDRAQSGWGNPAVKDLVKDMPQGTPQQKGFLSTQQNELKYLGILRYSPYVSHDAMETAIDKNLRPVFKGQIKLEDAAKQLQTDVNKLLRLGKQQVGS